MPGSGGSGGPSYALVASGTLPVTVGTLTAEAGSGGDGGPGGTDSDGEVEAPIGSDGLSAQVLELP